MLIPRRKVPGLALETLDHGRFDLASEESERGTVICFYRGLHCPICSMYLGDLNRRAGDFTGRGVDIVVVSTDGLERAADSRSEWKLDNLNVAYDLSIDKAREWGLYISAGRGKILRTSCRVSASRLASAISDLTSFSAF